MADREVLLDDTRVARIENNVRRLYPALPDDCVFLTYREDAYKFSREGREYEMPAQAVFCLLSPDPRGSGDQQMTVGKTAFRSWEKLDAAYQHLVGYRDPALSAFLKLVPVHTQKLRDLAELLPPDRRLLN